MNSQNNYLTNEQRAQMFEQLSTKHNLNNNETKEMTLTTYNPYQSKRMRLSKKGRIKRAAYTTIGVIMIFTSALMLKKKIDESEKVKEPNNNRYTISFDINEKRVHKNPIQNNIHFGIDDPTIFDENEVLFSIGSRSDIGVDDGFKDIYYSQNLEPVFEKYADMYGVDKNTLVAIASLESSLNHNACLPGGNKYNGCAVGMMQWQNPPEEAQENLKFVAYNYQTEHYDKEYLTMSNAMNLETNIKMAAMHTQQGLNHYHGNIYLTIARHHYGEGAVDKAILKYAEKQGITFDQVCSTFDDIGWIGELNNLHNHPSEYGLKGSSNGTYGTDNYVQKVLACAFFKTSNYLCMDNEKNVYKYFINLETANVQIDPMNKKSIGTK